jgi:hypothetical protein
MRCWRESISPAGVERVIREHIDSSVVDFLAGEQGNQIRLD